jgi:polyisoprenoid-binding protein YceI
VDEKKPRRRNKWVWWLGGTAVMAVLLAVGGPFVYIHLIEGPPPAKLALPSSGSASVAATSPGASGVAGTWHVGTGSLSGYRVSEVLLGQKTTAVGRTSDLSGSITISATTVTSGSFTVSVATVKSDQSQRNAQFNSARIMDTVTYPTATLVLTRPIPLGTIPTVGSVHRYPASGRLTMHGVTRPVSFTVEAHRTAAGVYVLADIPITFADWHIANPSIGGFVTTADTGTLETLLVLTTAAGNPSAAGQTPTTSTPVSGGPVTVPSTTTPALGVSGG